MIDNVFTVKLGGRRNSSVLGIEEGLNLWEYRDGPRNLLHAEIKTEPKRVLRVMFDGKHPAEVWSPPELEGPEKLLQVVTSRKVAAMDGSERVNVFLRRPRRGFQGYPVLMVRLSNEKVRAVLELRKSGEFISLNGHSIFRGRLNEEARQSAKTVLPFGRESVALFETSILHSLAEEDEIDAKPAKPDPFFPNLL